MRENFSLTCDPEIVPRVPVPQMRSQCAGQCAGSTIAPGRFAPEIVPRVPVPQMRSQCAGQCAGSTVAPGRFAWSS
jgi:hypothetical protein